MDFSIYIKDLLYAVFVFPLTAGNMKEGQKCPDGTISAVIAVNIWLAVMCVLIQGRFNPDVHSKLTVDSLIHFVISFNILLGLCGFLCVAIISWRRGIDHLAQFRGVISTRRLRIIFMWIFGIGTILNCLEKVFRNVFCVFINNALSVWSYIDYIADATYNVFLSIFTLTEMCLIHNFVSYKFKHTNKIHYCMVLIIGANLSVWFHTFNLSHNSYSTDTEGKAVYNSSLCFKNGTTNATILYKILSIASPIFRTAVLQFALLCVSLILEMWSPYKVWRSQSINSENEVFSSLEDVTNSNLNERTRLLSTTRSDSYSSVSLTQSHGRGTREVCQCTMYIAVLWGLSIVIPLTVFCVLELTPYNKQFGPVTQFYRYKQYNLSAYRVTVAVALYYGFYCLKRYMVPITSRKGYHPREVILLMSVFFVFQYYVYKVLAGIISDKLREGGLLMEGCIGILSECMQIIFILQSNRFKPRDTPNYCFNAIFMLMVVLSIGIWALDGFIGIKYSHHEEMIRVIGGDSMRFIKNTIYPVLVFYRFSTFFAYYSLYKKYSP